jgi:hypothetical protein
MTDHAGRALGEPAGHREIPVIKKLSVAGRYVRLTYDAKHVRLSVYRPQTGRTDMLAEVRWECSPDDHLAVMPYSSFSGKPAYMVMRNACDWFTVVDYHEDRPLALVALDRTCGALARLGRSMLLPVGGGLG